MKSRLPPLQSVYYFYMAAQAGSFKIASEQLFVSAAAISQQIRQLEEWLKCELFIRQHRRVHLTTEGQILYKYAQKGFSELYAGIQRLTQDPSPNQLSISTHPAFAQHWLVPKLQEFRQKHPDIILLIDPKDALVTFQDDSVDLCIRYGQGNYENLTSIKLMDEVLYPVCHPLYQKQHQIESVNDLYRVDLIEDMIPDMSWELWLNSIGAPTGRPTLQYEGSLFVLEGALAVQGVALMKHTLAHRYIQEGKLIRIGHQAIRSRYSYYICAPESYLQRKKVKVFIVWIQEQIATFTLSGLNELDIIERTIIERT
ncbi:Glycine cleavage system transcriptional activator [Vibrio ruber DSM 16370]|uniref:Glycine cleavage system transcriptional activator n=1 Tax=Vibrio ruber (strain DSM 16370 / JCM 11486 / BCRC 17186 / CECT 7878 / LMG 23124 / VR1) TaxID=1123498 RepID=A0A1R4LI26_VIBR1|nr:LysR substrate-binding domain-containing protein [Vibrio ruber]SJN56168.1 Glycine cleavage system transcriptional activator [Vibrio ruber DSM 16370]